MDPGSDGDIVVKPSGFDGDDFDLEDATGSFEVNDVANFVAHQSYAERGTGGEDLELAAFFDRTDQKALDLVVAFVADAYDHASNHRGAIGRLDNFGIEKKRFELADAGFHLALLLFGGVVVAIFGEIAHFTGGLNLAGNIDSTMGGELLMFGAQPFVGLLGELVDVGHLASVQGTRGTRLGRRKGVGLESWAMSTPSPRRSRSIVIIR